MKSVELKMRMNMNMNMNPLRYTEAALEQASSRGNLDVLEWWRKASLPQTSEAHADHDEASALDPQSEKSAIRTSNMPSKANNHLQPLPLLVSKSILYEAQNGQVATLRWWGNSELQQCHIRLQNSPVLL